MGLFDALFSSPQGAGLLDFLQNNAMNQQPMNGLPSDQAQYGQPQSAMAQMQPQAYSAGQPSPLDGASWPAGPIGAPQRNAQPSPLDNAQWPAGPNGAPSQSNAQMIPQQPPPVIGAQPMQQGPSAGDSLLAGAQGAGNHLMAGMQSFAHSGGILPAIANGISGLMTGQRNDPEGVAQQQDLQTKNLTARALIAKGVDPQIALTAIQPGNTEMLKSLIDDNFKQKTPMSIGSGYVYDPSTKKVTRLYEPDEKTPAGFATDDKGMHYVPGGPADPAYLRLKAAKEADPNAVLVLGRGGELYKKDADGNVTVVHKNQDAEGEPLTDAAVSLAADRAIAGDSKALTNLGRGAQGRADLVKINNAIAEKMKDNPNAAKQIQQNVAQQAGLVSSSRALGTKETHFGVAEKAMEESIPLAQAASDAVPRSEWMTVNKLMQAGEREHSNPLLKKFLIANDTAVKDYARTINPTGALRESDIEYARKTLSTTDGPEAYSAGLAQLQMEAGVMHRAIQRQKAELQGGAGAPPAISGKTQNGVSWGLVR